MTTLTYMSSRRLLLRPALQLHNRAMPSTKGEPTDPELREKIKEEVKAEEKGAPPLQLLWRVGAKSS